MNLLKVNAGRRRIFGFSGAFLFCAGEHTKIMTPTDLSRLLARLLTGAAGHDEAYWLKQIGPVEALPIYNNVRSNWRVSPIAIGEDLHAITRAVEIVRIEYPYVAD